MGPTRLTQTCEIVDEDTDIEMSSINGSESPPHLQAKLKAGKQMTVQNEIATKSEWDCNDEIEAMKSWDFDAGSARVVGEIRKISGCHISNFISPYWEAAGRRALVDGLIEMHSKAHTKDNKGMNETQVEEQMTLDHAPPPKVIRHDLNYFMDMSFYEIFGVPIGASPNAIRKAYNALALVYHPDKGGDNEVFKYICMAYTVLMDKKTRKDYDCHEKAKFTTGFGSDIPSSSADKFIYILEPIDTKSDDLMDILSRKAAGTVQIKYGWHENKSDVGTLRALYKEFRARSGEDGCIPVIWHRDQLHRFIQMPGRYYSGVRTLPSDLPTDFKGRIDNAMQKNPTLNTYDCTVSLFDKVPRLAKEIFRVGLKIADPDQPKCFPRAMLERHSWSRCLRQWVEDKGF
jgi:hypothetical protein